MDIIHDSHDTLFRGMMPAPAANTLRPLIAQVIDYGFDIGIATDGDADRLGVVDDTGRYLHPNDILVLLYYYLVKYKGWHGAVVRNVATTHRLDAVAERFGENCYEVPVGFKYISAKMREVDAVIGGESSGGLTVRGHINGKDGIYAAMLLIEMIAVTGRRLSEICRDIEAECGSIYMEERALSMTGRKKKHQITAFCWRAAPCRTFLFRSAISRIWTDARCILKTADGCSPAFREQSRFSAFSARCRQKRTHPASAVFWNIT